MQSAASTARDYLAQLPDARRELVTAVHDTIVANLPEGYEEAIQYGMLSYIVPLDRFANTYNGQPLSVVSLANQKNYVSLYLMGVYSDERERAWFEAAWTAGGHRLDMGKSCVRFKQLDAVPLDVIGQAVARVPVDAMIAAHERAHGQS